jgi:hypothetical protein
MPKLKPTNEKRVRVGLKLKKECLGALDIMAKSCGLTRASFIEVLIADGILRCKNKVLETASELKLGDRHG